MLPIAFIGAGAVNFGGGEGPWDHATRLEKLGRISVVGIADPNLEQARRALAQRRAGASPRCYADTRVFGDFHEMLAQAKPAAVFIGVSPCAHAQAKPPGDIELACAAASVHMFIEKPLSCSPPADIAPIAEAVSRAESRGLIVSVGYMFRYSRAVQRIRERIAEIPGGLRTFVARYNCAYSQIGKKEWWDTRTSGGPIVEQATHFCDLARLLGGEVDLVSVQAVAIAPGSPKAKLADGASDPAGLPLSESMPEAFRVPRSTAAVWRFESGAIGSLTHGTLLHGTAYESELEVWCDGLRMVLCDPYGACRLLVRERHSDRTEAEQDIGPDDTYLTEDSAFLDAVRASNPAPIRSTYADAFKTHQFTWAIRHAAERASGATRSRP